MSQENVEIARRSYEAWHRGDFDAVQARTAPHGKVVQLIQGVSSTTPSTSLDLLLDGDSRFAGQLLDHVGVVLGPCDAAPKPCSLGTDSLHARYTLHSVKHL
jgi:hypothetical protein